MCGLLFFFPEVMCHITCAHEELSARPNLVTAMFTICPLPIAEVIGEILIVLVMLFA